MEERGASSCAPVRIQVGRGVTIQVGASEQSAPACSTGGGHPVGDPGGGRRGVVRVGCCAQQEEHTAYPKVQSCDIVV